MTDEIKLTEPVEITPKVKVKTANIPSADFDLLNLAKKVGEKWSTTSITLQWISVDDYKQYVATYDTALSGKSTAKAIRNPLVSRIRKIETKITDNIVNVKNYLLEMYGKIDSKIYYAEFGIIKEGKVYRIPKNQEACKQSLEMLLKALAAHNMIDNTYGLAFWTKLRDEYNQLMDGSINKTSDVSLYVGQKNQAKDTIVKVLNSLMHSIKANYPDMYKNELRVWGFQKERY